jgi:hypothetical protein
VTGGRIADGYLPHALLVEQPAQLAVDLPGGELTRVKLGTLAVDLGDLRHAAVELDEPAGVVGGAVLGGYRVQTITAPS